MVNLARKSRRHAVKIAVIVGVAAIAGFAALAVSASRPGNAAYPGANGHIAYANGENYAYGGGSIWVANGDGSSPTALTAGVREGSPAYSSNGSRIAFERENGVAVMNADGSGAVQLLNGGGTTSSETKWLKNYETSEKPPRTIPVVRVHTVKGKWRFFGGPSFSPDGSQLAVSEGVEDTSFASICAVASVGDEECLEYGSGESFFDYEFECITCTSGIITVSSTTGAKTGTVSTAPEGAYDTQPTYAADGKLAFARRGPSSSQILVVNSPGAVPSPVASGYQVSAPDFSPDGSRIAFSHNGEIALVGTGGGPLTILPTPGPAGSIGDYAGSPAFSPDGTKIAFERTVTFKGSWEYGIFAMSADGTGMTKIVDRAFEPTWQPLSIPVVSTPASAKSRKGKVRLDKKGKAKVGSVLCGSSDCTLKVISARLKAGRKSCAVKASLPKSLAAGDSANVKVRISGRCMAALKKAGRGLLTVKVRVTDALGQRMLTLRSTIVPRPARHSRK